MTKVSAIHWSFGPWEFVGHWALGIRRLMHGWALSIRALFPRGPFPAKYVGNGRQDSQ
jgi:hypothetical protein